MENPKEVVKFYDSDVPELFSALKRLKVEIDSSKMGELLVKLCYKGSTGLVKELLKNGADVNHRSDGFRNERPANIASVNGRADILRVLFEYGCNFNLSNSIGTTPLMYACEQEYIEIVRLILRRGANVNQQDSEGRTAIFYVQNSEKMVELLIENGCNINITDEIGFTPLNYLCFEGKVNSVRVLLRQQCDVNRANEYGMTPLMAACSCSNYAIVKMLIDRGANVKCQDKNGQKPYNFLGIIKGDSRKKVAKLLAIKGAEIHLDHGWPEDTESLKEELEREKSSGYTYIFSILTQEYSFYFNLHNLFEKKKFTF